ncbi:MAG: hypothetical protein KDD75_18540 [Caldilineaceae bacterium]|jgi:signal transduction histidine kinase|nr:hypothetical protein [Caldilineaceae bacterium]MCB0176441.1 hypothetical protein [Anaerolineae bacterium]MCB9125587.1 hypothetical protein [Caldilineaceae bacterium]
MALSTVLLLAAVWGVVWALFLQYHPWGQWLAVRRTWLTVVAGVGVDLALLATVLDLATWLTVAGVIAASSIGIIARSIANERREDIS